MRWLFLCEGGVARSVAFAWAMKVRGVDALAASVRYNSPDTLRLLCGWANRRVLLYAELSHYLPTDLLGQIEIHEIGQDRWGTPMAPELMAMAAAFAEQNLGP